MVDEYLALLSKYLPRVSNCTFKDLTWLKVIPIEINHKLKLDITEDFCNIFLKVDQIVVSYN